MFNNWIGTNKDIRGKAAKKKGSFSDSEIRASEFFKVLAIHALTVRIEKEDFRIKFDSPKTNLFQLLMKNSEEYKKIEKKFYKI